MWRCEATCKKHIYNSRHVASRKCTYSQALHLLLIGQIWRPWFAHPWFDWMNELSLTYVLVRHASGQYERSMAAVLRGFRFVSGSFCKHVAFGVGKSNKLAVYSDFARRCVLIKAEFVSRRLPVTRKLYFCSEFHSSSASSLNMNDMRTLLKLPFFLSLVVWTRCYLWTSDRIRLLFLLKRKYWKK